MVWSSVSTFSATFNVQELPIGVHTRSLPSETRTEKSGSILEKDSIGDLDSVDVEG